MRGEYIGEEVPLVPGGLRVYRDWRIYPDGTLFAVSWPLEWTPGVNEAVCTRRLSSPSTYEAPRLRSHPAPQRMCTCGIYGKYKPEDCYGVAELSGRMILGTKGARAEFGRPLAITAPGLIPGPIFDLTKAKYPDIKWFTNRQEMLEEFPPQDVSELISEPEPRMMIRNLAGDVILDVSTTNYDQVTVYGELGPRTTGRKFLL